MSLKSLGMFSKQWSTMGSPSSSDLVRTPSLSPHSDGDSPFFSEADPVLGPGCGSSIGSSTASLLSCLCLCLIWLSSS